MCVSQPEICSCCQLDVRQFFFFLDAALGTGTDEGMDRQMCETFSGRGWLPSCKGPEEQDQAWLHIFKRGAVWGFDTGESVLKRFTTVLPVKHRKTFVRLTRERCRHCWLCFPNVREAPHALCKVITRAARSPQKQDFSQSNNLSNSLEDFIGHFHDCAIKMFAAT